MAITINGSGTITGLSTGGLPDGSVDADTLATDSVTAAKLKSDAIAAGDLPAGSILQVVQVEKTDVVSFTASHGVYNTIFSASITPASTANKILIMWSSNVSAATGQRGGFRIARGSTPIGIGDAASNRTRAGQGGFNTSSSTSEQVPVSQVLLDSPSTTSSTTYNLQCCMETSGGETWINKSQSDSDAKTVYRSASHIILMEVAG